MNEVNQEKHLKWVHQRGDDKPEKHKCFSNEQRKKTIERTQQSENFLKILKIIGRQFFK